MKQAFVLILAVFVLPFAVKAQTGVSINSTGAAPDSEAILDISSKTKGVQLPRLTTAEATTLAASLDAGDDGMIVYDTDLKTFKFWDGNMLSWTIIGTGSSGAQNLDQAYDGGGSGVGRTITADAGDVEIQGVGDLVVDANVGIGATNPDRRLKISGTGWTALEVENTDNQDAAIELTSQSVSNYVYTDNSGFLGLESAAGQGISMRTDGNNERMVVQSDGRLRVNNLADPNGAVVLSNPAGVLSNTPLTGNANDVLLGTGVFGDASNFDDHDWYQTLSTNTPTNVNDWIYTNGRVGIGIGGSSNPEQQLHVAGIVRSSGSYVVDIDGGNASGPRLTLGSNADPYAFMNLGAYSGINNLETKSRDFRIGSDSEMNALYLQHGSGNIGLSTNAPSNTLTIDGSNSDSYPILGLRSGNNNNGFDNGAQIAFGYNGTSSYQHFIQTRHNSSNSQNAIDFYVSDGTQNNTLTTGSIQTMSLVSGNVGIGTTSPAQKLQVAGTGRFNSLAGTGNRVVYANANGDLISSSSGANPNSLIDGSGTPNYLARWTPDGNTLGIGTTYDNGTNVGIGTTSPQERLHVNGDLRVASTVNTAGDNLRLMYGVRADDTSYEWIGFYSGTTRQGIILYDGAWSGANSSSDEFGITAENNNKLTLNTTGDHIALMPDGNYNVGIGTLSPAAKLQVDGGTNTEVRVVSDDNGASTISAYGASQGTGVLYIGQSPTYGGGIEYNGDGSPVTTGAGSDYISLFRRINGTDYWTARNRYNSNDWQFREDVDVDGYLSVGNPNLGATVKKGKKTFVDGSTINIYNGTGNYDYTWNMGQLDLPPGASSITVKAITYNMTGYRRDTDESIAIRAKVGGNTAGWTLTSSWTFGGGSDQYYDWNYAEENLNWTYTSGQTVQFQLVEENETCFFCNNDYFTLYNIEVTVFYEYSTAPQAGTILAEGRIYANSTLEMGDMAEYFEVVDEDAQVGHLVSLIPGSQNEYALSEKGYDPYILGVISENPSVVLNSPDVGPPVALAGRVNVKLVPGMPPIKSGDFITSSPQRGLAMKARKPGTVIGYAVENQQPGQDYVEILLQPGRFYYPTFDNEQTELPRQKSASGKR